MNQTAKTKMNTLPPHFVELLSKNFQLKKSTEKECIITFEGLHFQISQKKGKIKIGVCIPKYLLAVAVVLTLSLGAVAIFNTTGREASYSLGYIIGVLIPPSFFFYWLLSELYAFWRKSKKAKLMANLEKFCSQEKKCKNDELETMG